jgi:hypothetical protein
MVMMHTRFFLITGIVIFLSLPVLRAQNSDSTVEKVKKALKTADANKLSECFHSTIDLEMIDSEGNYSTPQAVMLVRDFFKKHPVSTFKLNHQGSSNDGSKYIIGTYHSKPKNVFRVYILMKPTNGKLLISQLQFEAE